MTPAWTVEVEVSSADADLASGLLWGAGVSAVGEADMDDDQVRLTTDVPPGGMDAIEAALGGRWIARRVEQADDGLDGWRPHAQIVRAGEHLVVQPPWLVAAVVAAPDDIVLDIDPGRSFGHGAHPTTRLCLAEIERLVRPKATVLDVGCGSGVLSVAAARLGADRVVAIDIDQAALAATAANASTNGVSIDVSDRPLSTMDDRFDLVLANIGAATLADLAADLCARTATNGRLVLSGLLADRWPATAAMFPDCIVDRTTDLDGWTTVVLRLAGHGGYS